MAITRQTNLAVAAAALMSVHMPTTYAVHCKDRSDLIRSVYERRRRNQPDRGEQKGVPTKFCRKVAGTLRNQLCKCGSGKKFKRCCGKA